MSKKSFNPPTVPWYTQPETKPLRPRKTRPLPEDVIRDKIRRGRYLQAVYNWVRANWKEGDYFYIMPGAPDATNYCVADRYGIFKAMKPQGILSRIFVEWLDEGHRINMEVTTFYKYAIKIGQDGESVPLPPIIPPEEHHANQA